MAKSECNESPFSRIGNLSRNSVKGSRPAFFSLLKQPITCNNTGGKTARNSEPVENQLFHYSKAGNESSNRMKMLEMKLQENEF